MECFGGWDGGRGRGNVPTSEHLFSDNASRLRNLLCSWLSLHDTWGYLNLPWILLRCNYVPCLPFFFENFALALSKRQLLCCPIELVFTACFFASYSFIHIRKINCWKLEHFSFSFLCIVTISIDKLHLFLSSLQAILNTRNGQLWYMHITCLQQFKWWLSSFVSP